MARQARRDGQPMGTTRSGRLGKAARGPAWSGWARPGQARLGRTWSFVAGTEWRIEAGFGKLPLELARQGQAGKTRRGVISQGMVWQDEVWSGRRGVA